MIPPAFIDFPAGSPVMTRQARAQVLAALRTMERYRRDTSAYLCALGPEAAPDLRTRRVDTVRRMLRRYRVARTHDEPTKCLAIPQGERNGVLITWWPQWR
ncbi:hypothetical protein [Sphingomonas sp. LT1P40]|uniref:hypothetical protein n=1 Tax=Alteristakelama amylovorans TaxID=3096166 RepID=UPI002FC855B7